MVKILLENIYLNIVGSSQTGIKLCNGGDCYERSFNFLQPSILKDQLKLSFSVMDLLYGFEFNF